ncbi:MAG: FAD-dependent oxidoreductase [Microbacterium sp.]|uniref:FAD-dependent oxidoreductase n=1 Tax=Microbacterium sp. TaxID=51671 RepID=UPI0039E411FD
MSDPAPTSLEGVRYLLEPESPPIDVDCDLVVYGATSGGVAAAYRAALEGLRVALLVFGDHIGGMSTGGLGLTDVGDPETVGGLARAFYDGVADRYGVERPEWYFEPHVAEDVFAQWLSHPSITVRSRQQLAAVEVENGRIREIATGDGSRFRAEIFIDASYEGDLLAGAGVTYVVGREDADVYGEPSAGARHDRGHQFVAPVDPHTIPGMPTSGLLPGIDPDGFGAVGKGDRRVQAYNFRLCVTTASDRIPFPRPRGYAPERYELLLRYIATSEFDLTGRTCPVHGDVYDMNNHGAVSSDLIGGSWEWPEATYQRRQELFDDHVNYQAGMLYFLANDPRVPAATRDVANAFGLSPHEYTSTSNWPAQLYVREARRMVGERVVTQHDALAPDAVTDPIALASYTMDSHHVRRYVDRGRVVNEGNVQQEVDEPFGVSYRSILPVRSECENLLVISAISASHVAYSAVRMEPVFMMLGDAAAVAAAISVEADTALHDVDYAELAAALEARGVILRPRSVTADAARENVS